MAILSTVYNVESGIKTTFYQSFSPTATTGIILNTTLNITKGVISAEINGQLEYISFGGTSVSGGRTTLVDVVRNLTKTANDFSQISIIGLEHIAGVSVVKLVNYHALFNLKANLSTANTFEADQTLDSTYKYYFFDTGNYIYGDASDLYFKSNGQSEIALTALANLSGVNDKAKVSAADLTEGYLSDKIVSGDGISVNVTNPGGDEDLEISLNTANSSTSETFVANNIGGTGLGAQSGTAGADVSDKVPVSFDGRGRLITSDGDDITSTNLHIGVSSSSANDGDPINYLPNGIVTVPSFSLAERQYARLWDGQINSTSNTTSDTMGAATQSRAQTFIPADGEDNISRVVLNMNSSTFIGSGVVKIFAISGTAPNEIPTGSAIGTSDTVSTWSTGDIVFDFSTPLAVTPGTSYAIVFAITSYSSGTIAWNYNNTSVYSSGNSATSSDSGASWAAQPTYDRRFKVMYRGLAGEPVFLSDTAGTFTLNPNSPSNKIGTVLDSTHVLLERNEKIIYGTLSGTMPTVVGGGTTSIDTEVSVGGRAKLVIAYAHIFAYRSSGSIHLRAVGIIFKTPISSEFGLTTGLTDDATISTSNIIQNITAKTILSIYYNESYDYGSISLSCHAIGPDTITFRRTTIAGGTGEITGSTYNVSFLAFLY